METALFKNRKPHTAKLLAYGFVCEGGEYLYETEIAQNQFCLTVRVANGAVTTQVVDNASGEEYVLYRAAGAVGAFVGMVRAAVEAVLADIAATCFEPNVFKTVMAQRLIAHVRETYGDELEFLWEKFPDNAVWRRRDTGKWYAALLTVAGNKIGLNSPEKIEILDLRLEPETLAALIDNTHYFPGYHMNKKHWYTVCLDGSVAFEELCERIDTSYRLAKK